MRATDHDAGIVMRFTVARPADRGRDSRAPDLAPWTTATTSG